VHPHVRHSGISLPSAIDFPIVVINAAAGAGRPGWSICNRSLAILLLTPGIHPADAIGPGGLAPLNPQDRLWGIS